MSTVLITNTFHNKIMHLNYTRSLFLLIFNVNGNNRMQQKNSLLGLISNIAQEILTHYIHLTI